VTQIPEKIVVENIGTLSTCGRIRFRNPTDYLADFSRRSSANSGKVLAFSPARGGFFAGPGTLDF
jgi:hypothetical protein